jgi:hypothetical protein
LRGGVDSPDEHGVWYVRLPKRKHPMKKLVSALSLVALSLAAAALPALAGDQYDVKVKSPSAKANERAVATVSLSPKGGFHVNTEYPVKLTVTAPDGVKVEKEKQTKDDAKRFEKAGLDFEVAFVAGASGRKSFTGELRFAVCTDTECKPSTEKVAFDVDVK